MTKNKNEQVTSDNIPDIIGDMPSIEFRLKKDKLLQKRLKQNPELKTMIGEKMITTATFTSDSTYAIDKQLYLLKSIADDIAGNWTLSKVLTTGDSHSFTITSITDDNKLTQDWISNYLISGVTFEVSKEADLAAVEESVIGSLLEMDLDVSKMAELLLKEEEEPDSSDAESGIIDGIQSSLVKMLPMTKALKLSPEKEKELKSHIDAAMSIMSSETPKTESKKVNKELRKEATAPLKMQTVDVGDIETGDTIIVNGKEMTVGKNTIKKAMAGGYYLVDGERMKTVQRVLYPNWKKGVNTGHVPQREAVDYPQFQFAVMVSREEYADAIRVLNDSNIKPKTSFNHEGASVLAFDRVQSDDAGVPKLSEEEIIKILDSSGIAAVSADGIDFMFGDIDQEADELDGSDELDQEDLVAKAESELSSLLFSKK